MIHGAPVTLNRGILLLLLLKEGFLNDFDEFICHYSTYTHTMWRFSLLQGFLAPNDEWQGNKDAASELLEMFFLKGLHDIFLSSTKGKNLCSFFPYSVFQKLQNVVK